MLSLLFSKNNKKPVENGRKTRGEVFTPDYLVKDMLNKLPKKVFSNDKLKWLDPSNGEGAFILVLVDMLDKGLKNKIKSRTRRLKHILAYWNRSLIYHTY